MSAQSPTLHIRNARLVAEGTDNREVNLLVKHGRIWEVQPLHRLSVADTVIDAKGCLLMAGAIDDQVHFREPGLTHKATIGSESRAAVAGGVTSFMEMPNTAPPTTTHKALHDKRQRAAETSMANYAFFFGATNDNADEVRNLDPKVAAGVKVFMGSSTGNMLVDDTMALENIFKHSPTLVAVHAEYEPIVRRNLEEARERFKDKIPPDAHPHIRSVEGCYRSSSHAVELAKKHGTRLHVLHISTEEELALFEPGPLLDAQGRLAKRITAEACVHHLWFTADDYARLGNDIKCNPAIKEGRHREAIRRALLSGRIDVVATDHAPHTREEKDAPYLQAPSGLPLVQHSVLMMMAFVQEGWLKLTDVPRLMAENVAELFEIEERGYIREGYHADLVIVDPAQSTRVTKEGLHYHCGWSPLEATTFRHGIAHTLVGGQLAYSEGRLDGTVRGSVLTFRR